MASRRRRIARRVLLVLTVLVTAAVATVAAGRSAHRAGRFPPVSPGSPISLPLDRYLLAPADVQRLDRANRILLRRCAGRFGYDTPPPGPERALPRSIGERRYGVSDPGQAAAYGYRLSAGDDGSPPAGTALPDGDSELLAVLTGDGRRSVRGRTVPEGGCHGEAGRRLGAAPAGTDMMLAQRLAMDSYALSRRDERVVGVVRAWSGCMRDKGFDYPGPMEAAADERFRGAAVTAAEIATASADVACKHRTNLLGTWVAVEAGYQRPRVAAHRDALERLRHVLQGRLMVARGIESA